jgi:hypothetical protein
VELKITAELETVWQQTLARLSGAARRMSMASVVEDLGRGGARQAHGADDVPVPGARVALH